MTKSGYWNFSEHFRMEKMTYLFIYIYIYDLFRDSFYIFERERWWCGYFCGQQHILVLVCPLSASWILSNQTYPIFLCSTLMRFHLQIHLSIADPSYWSTPTNSMVSGSEIKCPMLTVSAKKKPMILLMMISWMPNQSRSSML